MEMKPIHKHDCDKCRYMATTLGDSCALIDWYVCDKPHEQTVLGRRSSDGPDYLSYPFFLLDGEHYRISGMRGIGMDWIYGETLYQVVAREMLRRYRAENAGY